jgi:CDP-paratose 2-epimerase
MRRILITGICGFVGSTLAIKLMEAVSGIDIFGLDNFVRPGSEYNRARLKNLGISFYHGDIRCPSDFECLPRVDWVIDAAASSSILAGVDEHTSSLQLVENNLFGTVNLLEYCKKYETGFTLISTSRVYSVEPLSNLPIESGNDAYRLAENQKLPIGVSAEGVDETFSTTPPVSLYGSTKLASEVLALEYGEAFNFPVWINRCGVLAGAGQFGRPDQGIFAFWINSWLQRKPLAYIGFGGNGYQVRDCLHPQDLVPLLLKQMNCIDAKDRIFNLGGGASHAMSLAELSGWCRDRFGNHHVTNNHEIRRFDIPWMIMDVALAKQTWGWMPETTSEEILAEIADHAEQHPEWLELSGVL